MFYWLIKCANIWQVAPTTQPKLPLLPLLAASLYRITHTPQWQHFTTWQFYSTLQQ